MFLTQYRIHFIGIGGAGMCPMAEILVRNGYTITGSDMYESPSTKRLQALGVLIQYNHEPRFVREAKLCVYTSAVRADNKELVYAQEQGITCIKRAEMLGQLMRPKFGIAIAGTHGKTTTTSLIGTIFSNASLDPTVIIGGVLKESGSHAMVGNGSILITEADEYDRSFLQLFPSIAVITNIEEDHLDIYADIEDIKKTFIEFIQKVPFYGMVVLCIDDLQSKTIRSKITVPVITYGLSQQAMYRASKITLKNDRTLFTVSKYDSTIGTIECSLRGEHNIRNALAAVVVANEMKIPFSKIQDSLRSFKGVKRRFEVIGCESSITVVDDYAHHPSEIKATLDAANHSGYQRIIAVFQPHLYSRTRDFVKEFADALALAEKVFVMDIYKAREEPIPGVSSQCIVDCMKSAGIDYAHYTASREETVQRIVAEAVVGDAIILMGAGDITSLGSVLLERIREHNGTKEHS